MQGEEIPHRAIFRVSGQDRVSFLQGIVTNDVGRLSGGLVYAALLSPQGKYLADFFLVPDGSSILIDVDRDLGTALAQRLAMYRLRADVAIDKTALHARRGISAPPPDSFADPRNPALGWRSYGQTPGQPGQTDWDALRVRLKVPESGIELRPNESFILEMGFEALHGVDFGKGCYVGQEVTARMKHKTELRKGLARIRLDGPVRPGAAITADGREVGTVHTVAADHALAYLRFDRVTDTMSADGVGVRLA